MSRLAKPALSFELARLKSYAAPHLRDARLADSRD